MRVFTGFLLAAATLLGVSQTKPKETVVKEFYKSEAGSIRLLGVCSPEDGGYCWRANGKPNLALTKTFRKAYADSAAPFHYGKKTRIAIFDINRGAKNSGAQIYPRFRFYPYYLDWPEVVVAGRHTEPVEIQAPFSQKTTSLGFGVGREGTPSEIVPLRTGASTVYKGVHIKIAGFYSGGTENWASRSTVVLVTSSPMTGFDYKWAFIDRFGREIEFVDDAGKSVSGAEGTTLDPFLLAIRAVPQNAYITQAPSVIPEELTLHSQVDISEIAGLRFTRVANESITFKDIPLEPSK